MKEDSTLYNLKVKTSFMTLTPKLQFDDRKLLNLCGEEELLYQLRQFSILSVEIHSSRIQNYIGLNSLVVEGFPSSR